MSSIPVSLNKARRIQVDQIKTMRPEFASLTSDEVVKALLMEKIEEEIKKV